MRSLMDELGVGPLLYGCMRIGGRWDAEPPSREEREHAFAALDAARDSGLRAFDHADIYCVGKSERLFGEYLKSRSVGREQVVIQSKCGIRPGDGREPDRYDFSREHLLAAVAGSLERLGVDYLDVLLLHRPDPLGDPEEVAAAVAELRRRGWIRAFGVSNFSAAQIRLYRRWLDEPIRVDQVELSLLHAGLIEAGVQVNRQAPNDGGDGLLDFCREQTIDVQAWSPLAKGRLSSHGPGARDPRVGRTAAAVRDLAAQHGVATEAIVLAWLLRHPARIRPVVGTTQPDRIREIVAETGRVRISREDWYRLFNAAREGDLP